MMERVCAQESPFILHSPCILFGQLGTSLPLKPKGWMSPCVAASLFYFSPVPPFSSMISEEIISVLPLSRILQKAITATKKE